MPRLRAPRERRLPAEELEEGEGGVVAIDGSARHRGRSIASAGRRRHAPTARAKKSSASPRRRSGPARGAAPAVDDRAPRAVVPADAADLDGEAGPPMRYSLVRPAVSRSRSRTRGPSRGRGVARRHSTAPSIGRRRTALSWPSSQETLTRCTPRRGVCSSRLPCRPAERTSTSRQVARKPDSSPTRTRPCPPDKHRLALARQYSSGSSVRGECRAALAKAAGAPAPPRSASSAAATAAFRWLSWTGPPTLLFKVSPPPTPSPTYRTAGRGSAAEGAEGSSPRRRAAHADVDGSIDAGFRAVAVRRKRGAPGERYHLLVVGADGEKRNVDHDRASPRRKTVPASSTPW